MDIYKDENNGYRYILCIVDVFSRFAFAAPLKRKTAVDVFAALSYIVEVSGRKPKKLWVDEDKAFYNSLFKQWCQSNNVQMYSTYSTEKSVIVERFHRTLKVIMHRRFTAENTHRWVEMLPELIKQYNYSYHSTLGTAPWNATQSVYKNWVEQRVNPPIQSGGENREPKYKIDDVVRVARLKGIFEPGHSDKWTKETFKVRSIRISDDMKEPITYKLEDVNGEEVKGSWYAEELQKVKYPDFILIEEILDEKTIRGKTYVLVKYLGWDKAYNKWILKEEAVIVLLFCLFPRSVKEFFFYCDKEKIESKERRQKANNKYNYLQIFYLG